MQYSNNSEIVPANTVCYAMKMPIIKAFHKVFRLTAKKKGMPTTKFVTEVGVQQETA
jgi:hypothetical protein